jgi:hypothetical protein
MTVGRPVEARFGGNVGLMAIFVVSVLLHELAITLPVRIGFGLPTLYFTLHGMLTLLEKRSDDLLEKFQRCSPWCCRWDCFSPGCPERRDRSVSQRV